MLTISQQTLDSSQKTQARTNIGAASAADVSSLSDQIANIGDATFLKTSGEITSNFNMAYDAKQYHFLFVVIHAGANPSTNTYLDCKLLPINIGEIHNNSIVFNFITSNGATYFDFRAMFSKTGASGAFDSKQGISSVYVSVYGIK